jgi:hypothetical protein
MQQVKIGRESLIKILKESYLGFVNEHGVQPTHITGNQDVLEILIKVYSWKYPPLTIYKPDMSPASVGGKMYQLKPKIDNSIELFELSVVS